MKSFVTVVVMLYACAGGFTALAASDSDGADEDDAPTVRFKSNLQALFSTAHQRTTGDAVFNPGNTIAQIPLSELNLELRPDFQFSADRLTLSVKPRARAGRLYGGEFPAAEDRANDAYVNTWKLKADLTRTLSIGYGREVLQWGNGTFRSPSNPFFIDTGRLNPIAELFGKDFVSLVYTPSPTWSVSLIDNVGVGRREDSTAPFERTTALKLDYIGRETGASVIASQRRGHSPRLGGFLTYTASDALLLFGETTWARGSDGFYAQEDSSPVGWSLTPSQRDARQLFYSHLWGAAYTLERGPTLSVEYLRNNEGYDAEQAADYLSLGRRAGQVLAAAGPAAEQAGQLLGRGLDPNLRLLRRNYVFFQFLVTEYQNKMDLALRYAANLDDRGKSISTSITASVSRRARLFFVGSHNIGAGDTEFARLSRYSLFSGVHVAFF